MSQQWKRWIWTFALTLAVLPAFPRNKGIDPAVMAKAQAGDDWAEFTVGEQYEHGQGVPKDYVQAVTWYRKAAAQGNRFAQHELGSLYADGQGVPQDDAQAVVWFRKAAEQGFWPAQYSLAMFYQLGRGAPQDWALAAVWYRKAAEQGNAEAQTALATQLMWGLGVPQNSTEALAWFQKAAERGDSEAQYHLGSLYDIGVMMQVHDRAGDRVVPRDSQGVIPKNYTLAAMWYRKAAEQGNADAQNDLGLLYEDGKGVPQDYSESYFWLNLAAASAVNSQVYAAYAGNRDRVAADLTKAELSKVQERTRAWFASHPPKGDTR
jgi:TPR repeat protein